MIIRVVKMHFDPAKVDAFADYFKTIMGQIRNFEGCSHLEMWRATQNPNLIFTYSHWESEDDLENYRKSELFKSFWTKAKSCFIDKAEAWSVTKELEV